MTYIKLLTALAGLALLTACGGSAETPDKAGEPAVSCDTNPYGEDCGTEFETQRLNIVSDCRTDDSGDLCTDATTFACGKDFFHELCTAEEYVQQRVEFNKTCTNTKSQTVCDMEALARTCGANPFATGCDATYNDDRQTACESGVRTRTQCAPTIMRICGTTGDIFDAFCTGLPNIDTMRITDCITAGNAGIARCDNLFTASASNNCLTNPFTDACKADGAFGTYADMARMNRLTFCQSDSTGSSLCTALRICRDNLFDPTCGAYFEPARISHCETNDVVVCPNVTTADWLASFTGNKALTTTPNTTPTNEFLAITATTASSRTAVVPTTLFMTGSTTNGIAFFRENGSYYAGILAGTNLGAPITETITTAVKWTGQIQTVSTDNIVQLSAGEITDFGVDITFDGTEGEMTSYFTTGNSRYYSIDGTFDANGIITGDVAYGEGTASALTTTSVLYSPGTLRGIIGQNGAVGVFHSGHKTLTAGIAAFGFSGGFVVTPPDPCVALDNCVDTADWLASFEGGEALPTTPNTTTRENQFLQATATGFADGANVDIRTTFGSPQTDIAIEPPLTFASADTATGGVAFFGGSLFNDSGERVLNTYYYYAGVLAGTNLGAPITETITSARWTGQIRAIGSSNTTELSASRITDFGLNITFDGTEGTIKSAFVVPNTGGFAYEIDGTFDDKGIISGWVAHGAGDASGVNTTDPSYSPGTLSGIIGQNGAVGAFHRGHETLTAGSGSAFYVYSGGFVVTPPAN